jgi:hypothetical protein
MKCLLEPFCRPSTHVPCNGVNQELGDALSMGSARCSVYFAVPAAERSSLT